MINKNKKLINLIQLINFSIVIAIIVTLILLDKNNYINLGKEFGFIILGVILLMLAIFGYLKNEILLTRTQPYEYDQESSTGKIINIIIGITGIFFLWIGIIVPIIK